MTTQTKSNLTWLAIIAAVAGLIALDRLDLKRKRAAAGPGPLTNLVDNYFDSLTTTNYPVGFKVGGSEFRGSAHDFYTSTNGAEGASSEPVFGTNKWQAEFIINPDGTVLTEWEMLADVLRGGTNTVRWERTMQTNMMVELRGVTFGIEPSRYSDLTNWMATNRAHYPMTWTVTATNLTLTIPRP